MAENTARPASTRESLVLRDATIANDIVHNMLPETNPQVLMVLKRPIEVRARRVNRGACFARILVFWFDNPQVQHLLQDVVGFATTDLSLMGAEHHVKLSFPAKREKLTNAHIYSRSMSS